MKEKEEKEKKGERKRVGGGILKNDLSNTKSDIGKVNKKRGRREKEEATILETIISTKKKFPMIRSTMAKQTGPFM